MSYHAPTINPIKNPTLHALLFNTAKIPRYRTRLTSDSNMYAAGSVKPQPNPLMIRPTKTGVKENIPTMMQTHPASSNIIPSLSVHKHPIFSITDPLNNVPIMMVNDSTLTAIKKQIRKFLETKL
jgi:hypothetical protein